MLPGVQIEMLWKYDLMQLSIRSPIRHFSSSVEDMQVSEASGHSWKKGRKIKTCESNPDIITPFRIRYSCMQSSPSLYPALVCLGGTFVRGMPVRRGKRDTLWAWIQNTKRLKKKRKSQTSYLPCLLHLLCRLGPVLHVLLWRGVGGTLHRQTESSEDVATITWTIS